MAIPVDLIYEKYFKSSNRVFQNASTSKHKSAERVRNNDFKYQHLKWKCPDPRSNTHLLALEESFSVTVGKVQRQSHYTRGVLHSLNDPIQFSPAWTLQRNTAYCYN